MLSRITSHGVVSEAEIDLDTLESRLAAERQATDAVYDHRHGFLRLGA
ncbi:MAG TPA: hypothetical protein VGE08_12990 [Steroidobacter sp.]